MAMGQLASQIILMFLLMGVGLLTNKLGFMHAQTATDLTNILLYIVSPCLIVNAFEQRFSTSRLQSLALVLLGILLTYGLMVLITKLAFNRVADPNLKRIMQFGAVYSNAGFMGVPLAVPSLGVLGSSLRSPHWPPSISSAGPTASPSSHRTRRPTPSIGDRFC